MDKSPRMGNTLCILKLDFIPILKLYVWFEILDLYMHQWKKIIEKILTKDPGFVNHSKMQNTTTQKRVETWSSTPPVGLAFERIQQMLLDGTASNRFYL
jgi:hypothetical protein